MSARIKFVVPVVVAAAAALWFFTQGGSSDADALFASGTVEATTADLGFERPGRIASVLVDEGDRVEAGQELARLETRSLDASRAAAEAQLQAVQARLGELLAGARPQEIATAEAAERSARQRAETGRRDVERARALFEGGAISRQALDQAETAAEVADAAHRQASEALALVREGPRTETIRAQRAAVEQARAGVALADAALADAMITAPFDGVVTVEHRRVGETVTPGAPVVTILDRSDRWVRIYVREDRIGRVQIGMTAAIGSDTYPDRVYEGEVTFIGSEAEFTPRNVQTPEERTRLVYPVKVRIVADEGFELKPGVPADVTLREPGS